MLIKQAETVHSKSSLKHESHLCQNKIDKVDLLLDDYRKNPDEALQCTVYLRKRRNAMIGPLKKEEIEKLKRFSVLLDLVDTIDLELPCYHLFEDLESEKRTVF